MKVVPQIFVIILSGFLYFQYTHFRASGTWTKSGITFGKYHLPILALLASTDLVLCIEARWMAIPAILTGIAITWVIDR